MKKTPLKRTPFKKKWDGQKPSTLVQGEKISREGASTLRWKAWRRRNRLIALKRAQGQCEWHLMGNCNGGRIDWHHVFLRTPIISEPWASFHPFTLMLCESIHRKAHEDSVTRLALEWRAIHRFLETPPYSEMLTQEEREQLLDWEAKDVVRELVRKFTREGVLPNAILDPPVTRG